MADTTLIVIFFVFIICKKEVNYFVNNKEIAYDSLTVASP